MSQALVPNTNWALFFFVCDTVYETVSHTSFVKTVKSLIGYALTTNRYISLDSLTILLNLNAYERRKFYCRSNGNKVIYCYNLNICTQESSNFSE